jgi:cyclic pyranopterin phosphate synthase
MLKEAGLARVTVSLDSLRENRFARITGRNDFGKVIRGIEAARSAELEPVKVNCVVVKGLNEDEIVDFARWAAEESLTVRFIEFMPIDEDEGWTRDRMVTGDEIMSALAEHLVLTPLKAPNPSDTARNYRVNDSQGVVGLITSVSRPFCGECSRLRLTADGRIRTCLFSTKEYSLRELLRSGANDDQIRDFLLETTQRKEQGHRINEPDFVAPSRTMSYIGG